MATRGRLVLAGWLTTAMAAMFSTGCSNNCRHFYVEQQNAPARTCSECLMYDDKLGEDVFVVRCNNGYEEIR